MLNLKKCIPCEEKVPPLSGEQVHEYLTQIPGWTLSQDEKNIFRIYTFTDFIGAVDFVNHIADIAEQEGHHPDIAIHYNNVTLTLWTHAVGGLSENDFILAAKIDSMRI